MRARQRLYDRQRLRLLQVRRRDPVTRQPVVDEGRPYTSMDEPLIPSVSSRPSLVPSSAARTAGRLSPSVDFLRMDEDDFDEEESDAGDDRATSHALAGSGSGSNSSKTGTVLMSVGREMVRVSKEDVVRAEQFNEIGARLRNIAAVQVCRCLPSDGLASVGTHSHSSFCACQSAL